MTLAIRRGFPRPPAEAAARLARVPTGFVADAQGRRGALDHRLRPIVEGPAFAGPAVTVRSVPNDNLAAWVALTIVQPGDVIVLATEDCQSSAVVGDLFVGMARNAGAAAVITDGLVRDLDGLEAIGLPVYARGLTPNSPGKNGPGRIGVPVSVGGVPIDAGDMVVGDRSGVVVVPQASLPQVLAELDAVEAKEASMDKAVSDGAKVPGWVAGWLADNPPVALD